MTVCEARGPARRSELLSEQRTSHSVRAALGAVALEWNFFEALLLALVLEHDPELEIDGELLGRLPGRGSWPLELYAARVAANPPAAVDPAELARGVAAARDADRLRRKFTGAALIGREGREGIVDAVFTNDSGAAERFQLSPAVLRRAALMISHLRAGFVTLHRGAGAPARGGRDQPVV